MERSTVEYRIALDEEFAIAQLETAEMRRQMAGIYLANLQWVGDLRTIQRKLNDIDHQLDEIETKLDAAKSWND